jgi:hypothetical protein
MLAGLRDLNHSELEAFAKETQTFKEGASQEALFDGLLAWMGSRVDAKGAGPAEIERAVLAWLAQRLELTIPAGSSTDDIEASVRRKIAEESYEFLFPFLAVGSAVAYLGPSQVIGPKLELLEAASAALIPSHSARERMRGYWSQRGSVLQADKQVTPQELLDYFMETLTHLAETGLPTRLSILILNHVVALSDGRYEQPEEVFMQALADTLKVDRAEAERVRREVSETFWKQLTALGGGTYQSQGRQTEDELSLNMRAAQLTLEATGGLASFNSEVEQGFVASLHRSLQRDSAFRKGLKGGGALGFATGMLCYIKERWRVGDHEILMRLSLAAIFRQHLEATGDHARITTDKIEGYLPQSKVENVADTLAETAVGKSPQPGGSEGRRISLEPKTYPEFS